MVDNLSLALYLLLHFCLVVMHSPWQYNHSLFLCTFVLFFDLFQISFLDYTALIRLEVYYLVMLHCLLSIVNRQRNDFRIWSSFLQYFHRSFVVYSQYIYVVLWFDTIRFDIPELFNKIVCRCI